MILNIHWYYFLLMYLGVGISIPSIAYVFGFFKGVDTDEIDEIAFFVGGIILWPILLTVGFFIVYIYALKYLREFGVEYKKNLKIKALAWWVRYQAKKKKKPQTGLPDWF